MKATAQQILENTEKIKLPKKKIKKTLQKNKNQKKKTTQKAESFFFLRDCPQILSPRHISEENKKNKKTNFRLLSSFFCFFSRFLFFWIVFFCFLFIF